LERLEKISHTGSGATQSKTALENISKERSIIRRPAKKFGDEYELKMLEDAERNRMNAKQQERIEQLRKRLEE